MSENMLELTDDNFKDEIAMGDKLVLVDFWAPWCGPCRMIAPIVEEIASELSDKVKVGKLNTDENRNIAIEYEINMIPTLILFKDGKPVEHIIGAVSKNMIVDKIEAHAS